VGSPLVTFDGTIRVECHSNGRTASGDLYRRRTLILPTFPPHPILAPGPNPANGIPILARSRYRYYLRITQILEGATFANGFNLGFELYRFNQTDKTWTNDGARTARMTWSTAPAGYPSLNDYMTGDVKDATGAVVGRLTMGWVSRYLRKATVEIDRVNAAETPLDNGAGIDWKDIGDGFDWDITVDQSDSNLSEPSGESWSNAEAHASMLVKRDLSNLDTEWRYHVLCVRRLDATERGIMYDNGATDSNNVPREGCAISSHWTIPNTNTWGLVKGMRFGSATKPYFRTAVHETGHAMGLYHNTIDRGFMNTTDVIAAAGTSANPFPNNIQWSFAADDRKRLRHMPDIYVRPGGVPFGTSYASTPISPTDMIEEADGLELTVTPLLEAVPLGAPVRFNLKLTNTGKTPVFAPSKLSMGAGTVFGAVTDPSGAARPFAPLVLCVDEDHTSMLDPGKSIEGSITVLRGGQGALFPSPGRYQVRVDARWDAAGVMYSVNGAADVMVTASVDDAHAVAALRVLSTPDALLTLVMGGDHCKDGVAAIQAALKNPVLKPHYAHIEAKRLGERFGKRKSDWKSAAALLDDSTVMSQAEIRRAAELARDAGGDGGKLVAKTLKTKASAQKVSSDVRELVDAL
jgi:hypothetical protein